MSPVLVGAAIWTRSSILHPLQLLTVGLDFVYREVRRDHRETFKGRGMAGRDRAWHRDQASSKILFSRLAASVDRAARLAKRSF
jgi:hypothetical protein